LKLGTELSAARFAGSGIIAAVNDMIGDARDGRRELCSASAHYGIECLAL
jgi:hypothetical protein